MSTCTPHDAHLARLDLTKQFLADIRGRFRPIRGRIRHFADYPVDGFGLKQSARTARLQDGSDTPESWPDPPEGVTTASTPAGKAAAFATWLREVLTEDVLEPMPLGRVVRLRNAEERDLPDVLREWDHWTGPYILAAFTEGWEEAGGRLRVRGGRIASTQLDEDRDVIAAFDLGVPLDALRELYLQAYVGLREIVDDAAADDVRRVITEGFAAGKNPRDIARELTSAVAGLQRRRAETHVRTITQHTRTQSTLGRYQAAGESVVSHTEFSDSNDTRVCPFCRRLDGAEMTVDEMLGTHVLWRGSIYRLAPPAHAGGRCTPLPSVGGSPPTSDLADRVPGTIVTTTANPLALSL